MGPGGPEFGPDGPPPGEWDQDGPDGMPASRPGIWRWNGTRRTSSRWIWVQGDLLHPGEPGGPDPLFGEGGPAGGPPPGDMPPGDPMGEPGPMDGGTRWTR